MVQNNALLFYTHQHKIFICEGNSGQKVNLSTLLSHIPHVGRVLQNSFDSL